MQSISDQIRVAVLLGGVNSERDVSMESGQRVIKVLEGHGYESVPVVYEGDLAGTVEVLRSYDLVFNALHGGEGEDGTVQAALDQAGLRYTGSRSRASSLSMDKDASKKIMSATGVPTAPWACLDIEGSSALVRSEDHPELLAFLEDHPYPVVIKPNQEGSTVGLSIVEDPTALDEALALASEFGSKIIAEVYIPGRELTVTVLNERPLPVVEIIPKHKSYDYECKYSDGMSTYHVPAELPLDITSAIQGAAGKLYQELGCRHYARIDFRLNDEGHFFCLELNTLPGMTTHSLTPMAAQAVGIGFAELISIIVNLAIGSTEMR
jgi:D-alanine-D-alanine ligase